jgi:hypothetical protein
MSLGHGASIVRSGLVLHLDAANNKSYPGTGTTVFDLSDFKTNSTVYQATFNSNYFEFDGVDDNIYIGSLSTNAPQISQIREFVSVEVAFYPYSVGGDDGPALVRCGLGTDITFGLFYNKSSKALSAQWYADNFAGASSNNNIVNLDTWNIASFSRNGSSISFYMNGAFVNTVSSLSTPTPTPSALGIGAARAATAVGTTGQDVSGRISTVKIYNRALSATEIKQNFEAIRGRYNI